MIKANTNPKNSVGFAWF